MFHPRLILSPTDLSSVSVPALQLAADLARQHQAKLLVLYVAETLGPANVTYGEVGIQLEPEGYQQRLFQELLRSAPLPEGIPVEFVVTEGDPAEQIERTARERGCDLIVMGTHGRTGLSRLLRGAVAEAVVRHAPCPVLTVRMPRGESG